MDVKYPNIQVTLSGTDGNAYAIIGRVQSALQRNGVEQEEITDFFDEATSGDYDNVIQTAMKWVEVQ